MKLIENIRSFGGEQRRYTHLSQETGTDMVFSVYLPPQAQKGPVPVLYWLSGLTCTDKNFVEKSGFQRYAAEHGIAVVAPDTSPRGLDLPGEHDDWDFGSGAGFYVNATQAPWDQHYRMFAYVTEELPSLIEKELNLGPRRAISGHSMGGHGALICALKCPDRYLSVSAFSPITHPTQVPWGQKAFSNYLGNEADSWNAWDATELMKAKGSTLPFLIEQGTADGFLKEQLHPHAIEQAAQHANVDLTLHLREGYDHSYYFIASFIGEHLAWHAARLHSA